MFNNPIIQRELIGMLRTGKAMALQVALVAVLTILVLIKWPSDALVDLSGIQAQQMMQVFGYGLMAAIMLLAPAFPATSIVTEKQQGTLTLLLNSPMTRTAVLMGKIIGAMGFVILLLVMSLPAASACYALGGVDPLKQLGVIYLILLLLSLEYTAMGLWISSMTSSSDAALRLTYALVLLLAVVALGPHFFTQQVPIEWVRQSADWIRSLSPIPAMMEAMAQGGIGSAGIRTQVNLFGRFAVLSGALTIFFLMWTALRLDLRLFDRARPAGKVTDERKAGVRIFRRIMYLWFFDPQRRSGLIGPMTNPVMAKEFRSRRFGRSNWMMRMIVACLVISLLLTLATAAGVQSHDGRVGVIGGILVILQMTLIILLTPSLASSLISGELETGAWQLLQNTPLSARSIIFGKLISVMWTLMLVLAATLPGYVVLIYIQESLWVRITQVLITMLLTAVFALLLSAAVSSFFHKTAQATTVAYSLLVTLVAGTMLIWLGRGAPFTRSTVEVVLTVNPMAAALSLIQAPQFGDYHLVPGNWWWLAGGCVVCLLLLLIRTWRLTKPT